MNIGFIGAGRVGCSLGKYFILHGFFVSGYYSRSKESACTAAELTGTRAYGSMEELIKDSDVVFLTVPDGMISLVWEDIHTFDFTDKTVCHCSGAMSSEVFTNVDGVGGRCSLHPLMAVSGKEQDLRRTFFTIEGNFCGKKVIESIVGQCGNTYQEIDSDNKVRYHSAAAVASNLVTGILDMAVKMLVECGFSEENARKAMEPLVMGNAAAVMEKGAKEALTGPVSRKDYDTVKKHLEILEGNELEIYRLLSLRLLELSGDENTSEYMKMKGLLEK